MTGILTAGVPIIGALFGAILIAWGWKRITPPMSWRRMLRYLIVPIAFFVIFFALGALMVALVSGEIAGTYVFDGSRGPALWRVNSIVIFDDEGDTVERTRFDIFDIDSGRRLRRCDDYVHWWVVPIGVELLGEGRDVVWLYSDTAGLHTRDIYDGHLVKGAKELGAGGVKRKAIKYDANTRTVVIAARPLDAATPNRFAAGFDHELRRGAWRYMLQNGSLLRFDDKRVVFETVHSAHFADPWFLRSAQVDAELPDTFFIVDRGALSRIEKDGRVRWTQQGVLDSKRLSADAAFLRSGKLCVLQDDRLACFALDSGNVTWVVR